MSSKEEPVPRVRHLVLATPNGAQQFVIEESLSISVDGSQTWISTSEILPRTTTTLVPQEVLPSSLGRRSTAVTTRHYRPILMKPPQQAPEPIPVAEHYKQARKEDVPNCYAKVATKSFKELRLMGSSFLRAHASKHGITNASRKLTSQVLAELRHHYALAHLVKLEEDDSIQVKSPMVKPKRPKDPPKLLPCSPPPPPPAREPSRKTSSHSKKAKDSCTAPLIAKSLSELSSYGTSLLRPEAALHRVHNASRKSKDVVILELWDHYQECHGEKIAKVSSSPKSSTKNET